MSETQTDRTALLALIDSVLAQRVGDRMCDDCSGSGVVLEWTGPESCDEKPCPDCEPVIPDEVTVERALIEQVREALAPSSERPVTQAALRQAIVLTIDAWSGKDVPAANITSRRLADMLEAAILDVIRGGAQ